MLHRNQIQALSLVALLALMLILVGTLFLPYSSVLLWAAVCYTLMSPIYNAIMRRIKAGSRFYEVKRHFFAGFFALGTVVLMAGAFLFIVFQVVGQGRDFVESAMSYIERNPDFFRANPAGQTVAQTISYNFV